MLNSPVEREFFDAVAEGRIDDVHRLVSEAPELLQAYDNQCFGATPITRVCFSGDMEMLRLLVELGADVNRRSNWDMGPWSPLQSVVVDRRVELAEFLLANGAEMDVHAAAGLGRVDDVVRMLDEAPERVMEPGGDGCHPLHFADSVEVAEVLLERGADIEARCLDHYSTPVQYLADTREMVARFLFSKGATADIFSAVMADDRPVVESLLQQDAIVVNARMNQQMFPPGPEHNVHNIMAFTVGTDCTPLHAAAKANRPTMVDLLVKAGAEIDVRGGHDSAAPSHVAAWNDSAAAIERLLKCGADINIRSGSIHNNSPAGWAIVAGSADAFELLIDEGAEVFDWFQQDAEAAVAGEFRKFKNVPQQNYDRILAKLK